MKINDLWVIRNTENNLYMDQIKNKYDVMSINL